MKKLIVIAVLALLTGAVLGSLLSQHSLRQHQHALAVMWLSQFHVDALQAAVQTNNCAIAEQSTRSLHGLADELVLALPLADAQDPTFHSYVDKYRQVTEPHASIAGQCGYDAEMLKQVRAACAACHRDYR